MHEVRSSEAKTHFSQLLDKVEGGETVVITRHGRPVARLVPDEEARLADRAKAIQEMREAAKGMGTITVEEILAWRDEGRRI